MNQSKISMFIQTMYHCNLNWVDRDKTIDSIELLTRGVNSAC